MSGKSDIRRVGKAPRPAFFAAEPAADRVFAVVNALVTELAVLRERVDTLEQLATGHGLLAAGELEAYEPPAAVAAARAAWREAYLERVYAVLLEDIEAATPPPAE